MERFSIWNAAGFSLLLGASGTREAQLEQLGTIWNYLELFGTPQVSSLLLSAFPLTLKCVNFVNFVNFL